MQNPTIKTPIARCLDLGRYAARMLKKFPAAPELAACATKMTDITSALDDANKAYEGSKATVVETRVDVKFADFSTDSEIQNFIRRVEIADNKAGGPLFKVVAPEGKTPLTKPFGQKQLDVLDNLLGALQALVPTWAGAAQEVTTVQGLRQSYKGALDAREAAWQSARNLRVARNVARQAFVAGYVEISFKVKALYPQDRKMQDLFFDEVENEVEKDLGEEGDAAGTPPDGGASAATPPPAGTPPA